MFHILEQPAEFTEGHPTQKKWEGEEFVARPVSNTLGRAVGIIRLMVQSGAPDRTWGVRELATELSLPPSGVHRVLSGLTDAEWVARDPSGRGYSLGPDFMRLSFLVTDSHPLRHIARPVMEDLVAECDETVLLGVLDPTHLKMTFAASVESSNPLRYVVELNRWIPIHYSASGLGIMAFLPESRREEILETAHLPGAHEHTITDPNKIRDEIAKIQAQGYAISSGQRLLDAVGIAAPIFGPNGAVLGNFCITVPKQRFAGAADETRLSQAAIRHAGRITSMLTKGHRE